MPALCDIGLRVKKVIKIILFKSYAMTIWFNWNDKKDILKLLQIRLIFSLSSWWIIIKFLIATQFF